MMTNRQGHVNTNKLAEYFFLALCLYITIEIIWRLLKFSSYGFDFTDESFYLVWIANPFLYEGSTSQFGFIYHPLHNLLNGDIASLRRANILITFTLAFGLIYNILHSSAAKLIEDKISLAIVSAALATIVFVQFDSWLVTPNYNSLNLQALLIIAIGLAIIAKDLNKISIAGCILIGIGGWLVFMAKPSTALALAVGVFIYLIVACKFRVRVISFVLISATVPLFLSAYIIDGSVFKFVERIRFGIELTQSMTINYTLQQLLRIDEPDINKALGYSIVALSAVVALSIICMNSKNNRIIIIGYLVSIAFFVFTIVAIQRNFDYLNIAGPFQKMLLFSMAFAAIFAMLAIGGFKVLKVISMQQWSLFIVFLIMPHIFAFGTGNNYWFIGGSAGIFWMLAGLILMSPIILNGKMYLLVLPMAFATQAIAVIILNTGINQPYRQTQPLIINSSVLELGLSKSKLVLSHDYAEYISTAVSSAHGAGFLPNTPIIDLTGQSPGILYALGAKSIGQAWMLGGYPGSLERSKKSFSRLKCDDIRDSWVLFEPNGPRSIPVELMDSLGLMFPSGYERVSKWKTSKGAGGYSEQREQELYRPILNNSSKKPC